MYTFNDEDEQQKNLVEEPDAHLTYTYADYLKWDPKERLELFRGKIFKLAAPNALHQRVSAGLFVKLYTSVQGKSCMAFIAPFDVRLPVKNRKKDNEITTVVQPDMGVICDPSKLDARGACGAPDLVVEVLSPGNSKKEIRDKYELYEEAGVKEYWIISPVEQTIIVFLLNPEGKFNPAKIYVDGDRLESTSVSGFSIDITDLFTQ